MKNRILALLLVAVAVLICGCSAKKDTCSVDGCSQEVYKNGLCADHYVDVALSEAAASSEDSSESIDPAIAAVQEKYQEYVDEAVQTLRNSLKNPKSLDIYQIYLSDESVGQYYNKNIEICIDATAENSYGGTVRSEFYYQNNDFGKKFYECTSDAEKSIFNSLMEFCTGQRTSDKVIEEVPGYYHRFVTSKDTGESVPFADYLLIPESWYENS